MTIPDENTLNVEVVITDICLSAPVATSQRSFQPSGLRTLKVVKVTAKVTGSGQTKD